MLQCWHPSLSSLEKTSAVPVWSRFDCPNPPPEITGLVAERELGDEQRWGSGSPSDGDAQYALNVVPVHINLTVTDPTRSIAFYRKWLRFGPEDRRFPDGTVFIRDAEGTDLALHAGVVRADSLAYFHFGFRRESGGEVRSLHAELKSAGVPIGQFDDEEGLVSVKLRDPDGYLVEVYWER